MDLQAFRTGRVPASFASILLAGAGLLAAAGAARAEGPAWTSDYKAALAQAEKEKKDVLLDFTGSDWCGWCIRLNKEVFSQDAFLKDAAKNYILVELDYPRTKKLPEEVTAQNAKLSEEFGIQGYPTIFLVDSKGRPYAQTGYQPGGPEKYVQHLADFRAKREKRDEHLRKAEKAEGDEKATSLDAALGEIEQSHIFPWYDEVVTQILALDADDSQKFKSKYEGLKIEHTVSLELPRLKNRLGEQVQQNGKADVDALLKAADGLLEKTGPKGEMAQQIFLFKAEIVHFGSQDKDKAKVIGFLEKSVAAAPESQHVPQLQAIIAELKGGETAEEKSEE